MKSIIKKFFGNKKIIHDSDEYKSCDSEKVFFKKVGIKKKEIPNFECHDLFLLNIDDIEDNVMLKKNIKNCCQNGKFENLLLYNLDNVEKNFLKDLIVMMNKELDNVQLYKNENINVKTSENKKNNKNKNIIDKREEIYNCIKYVQNYLDKTIESKNTLELENI